TRGDRGLLRPWRRASAGRHGRRPGDARWVQDRAGTGRSGREACTRADPGKRCGDGCGLRTGAGSTRRGTTPVAQRGRQLLARGTAVIAAAAGTDRDLILPGPGSGAGGPVRGRSTPLHALAHAWRVVGVLRTPGSVASEGEQALLCTR